MEFKELSGILFTELVHNFATGNFLWDNRCVAMKAMAIGPVLKAIKRTACLAYASRGGPEDRELDLAQVITTVQS